MKKLCLLIICLPILVFSQTNNECYRSSNKEFKDSLIHEMFELVNSYRISKKLHTLIWDKKLQKSCKKHSMYQAYENKLCHFQYNKKNPYYTGKYHTDRSKCKSENCLVRYEFNSKDYNPWNKKIKSAKEIALEMFIQWKNSPGHNKNMLDPNWNYFAFDYYGYVDIQKKYWDLFYATQLFR